MADFDEDTRIAGQVEQLPDFIGLTGLRTVLMRGNPLSPTAIEQIEALAELGIVVGF